MRERAVIRARTNPSSMPHSRFNAARASAFSGRSRRIRRLAFQHAMDPPAHSSLLILDTFLDAPEVERIKVERIETERIETERIVMLNHPTPPPRQKIWPTTTQQPQCSHECTSRRPLRAALALRSPTPTPPAASMIPTLAHLS
eukprot:1341982-Pleurochrysis_carterae.AAC.2